MIKEYLTLLILLFSNTLNSQNFEITNQRTLGGGEDDVMRDFCMTTDDGYLLIGSSLSSSSGLVLDETNSIGLEDAWIVKLDADFNIEWQRLLGGDGIDKPNVVLPLANGGFLLGIVSNSTISGDKTVSNYGANDYWVVEIDSSGDIIWQQVYGGIENETLTQIIPYGDDYLLIGESSSGISGVKTEPSNGSTDHWIVCINSNGSLIWDKSYGGPSLDFSQSSFVMDNQFLFLSGTSWSGIGGDKTEDNFNSSADFWVLKVDLVNDFNVVWDKTLGGDSFENGGRIVKHNENLVVVCASPSNSSGNKTQDSLGENDLWIVYLDEEGEILWDTAIGGSSEDRVSSILVNEENNLIIYSRSNSNISEFKSEDSRGGYDFWIVEYNINELLINWERTIGGSSIEGTSKVIQYSNNHYALGGYSTSDISGEKTEDPFGEGDFWIVAMEAPNSIEEVLELSEISVYPNPIDNNFYFINSLDADLLEVYSINGMIMDRYLLNQNNNFLYSKYADYDSGLYTLLFYKDGILLQNIQIVVQ